MLEGNKLIIWVGSGFELSLSSTLVFSKKENIGRNQFKRSFSRPKKTGRNPSEFSTIFLRNPNSQNVSHFHDNF